ncbi:MAG TPA: ABC transporter permease subunit [Anaerolineae bacterium]|nr:ABC transporter permease subunit [Anaerolineae bacterium]
MTLLASLHKEVLGLARTYRLLILAIVLVAFGLLSPLLAKLMPELMTVIPSAEQFASLIPEPTVVDAVTQYVGNQTEFGLLLALLMTMGTVAQEKERGTAVLMLVKPLPRSVFLLSKFVALALAFLLCLAVAGLGGYYYTLLLFEAPDAGAWLVLNLLLWVYLLVYVALTLLASVLTRSQVAAAGVGFGAVLLLGLVSAIPVLGEYLPRQQPAWGAALMFDPAARSWPALWVSLGIIAASLVAAWLVFRRQEL